MNFLGFWILTIVLSYGLRVNFYCKIIKDIADKRYIFNTKRIKQLKSNLSLYDEKVLQISYIIPVINILSVFTLVQNYFKNKSTIFYYLKNLICISPMTNEEYEKYKSNSSINSIISIMYERMVIDKQKEFIMKKLKELKEENNMDSLKQEEGKFLQDKRDGILEESFYDEENNLLENETDLEDKSKVKILKIK